MTIYEIKRRVADTAPYFFSHSAMRLAHQTLRDFSVCKCVDGRYRISAPRYYRDDGRLKQVGMTIRYFNPANNTLERD